MRDSKNYIITIALLAVTLIGLHYVWSSRGISPSDIDLNTIPLQVGEWSGRDIKIDKRTIEILETEDVMMREYTNRKGESVYLTIVYSGAKRGAFHPPEVCYTGDGSRLLKLGRASCRERV